MFSVFPTAPRHRAYTLLEVLVSMAILLTGIIAVASFFPASLRENRRSADTSIAAYLAQMKVEEIRRDHTGAAPLVDRIRLLTVPTAPVRFPLNGRFAYSFSGVTVKFAGEEENPDDPRDDPGVARVIIRYSAEFRPQQDVLYELRFDE